MKRRIVNYAITACAVFGMLCIISGISAVDYAADFGLNISLMKDVIRPIIIGILLLCPTLFKEVI